MNIILVILFLCMLMFGIFVISFIGDVLKNLWYLLHKETKKKFQSLELLKFQEINGHRTWYFPVAIIVGAIATLFFVFGRQADFRAFLQKKEYTQFYNGFVQFRGDVYAYPVVIEVEKDEGLFINKLYFEDSYMMVDPDNKIQDNPEDGSIAIDPYGADAILEIGDITTAETVQGLSDTEMRPFDRAKIIGYDFGDADCWWTEERTGLIHWEGCGKISGYCQKFTDVIKDVEETDFCPDCFKYFETRIDEDGWW